MSKSCSLYISRKRHALIGFHIKWCGYREKIMHAENKQKFDYLYATFTNTNLLVFKRHSFIYSLDTEKKFD